MRCTAQPYRVAGQLRSAKAAKRAKKKDSSIFALRIAPLREICRTTVLNLWVRIADRVTDCRVAILPGQSQGTGFRPRGSLLAANRPCPPSFGKAKACILIFLYGSRRSMKRSIRSRCDAEVRSFRLDRVRAPGCGREFVAADIANHGSSHGPFDDALLRGNGCMRSWHSNVYAELRRPRDAPLAPHRFRGGHLGAAARRSPRGVAEMRNIALPWMLNSKSDARTPDRRHFGRHTIHSDRFHRVKHYCAALFPWPNATFTIPTAHAPQRPLHSRPKAGGRHPIERLNLRQSLSHSGQRNGASMPGQIYDHHRQRAYSMLTRMRSISTSTSAANPAMRERWHDVVRPILFERGGWSRRARSSSSLLDGFATRQLRLGHAQQPLSRLKEYLLPGFDLAYSTLIDDLRQRGLLDETWCSASANMAEHRRSIHGRVAGRHHWSRLFVGSAGGGMRGRVVALRPHGR